ncbi:amino acid adenylation domain-containing protein [Nocardiopsis mwathae]|uniref:Amino acid adenylation domain-containing protein n=1 Tax=Nocardiopsis mwathae TaxID=1472723 RepID=A0A7W9YDV4_9ACTN|nr:AMP-binding protein [Nocardiopsis mwathae]MBB6170287.1 amino acid adenylation domain-containing protein [Nocardiopsis mwathae]
MKETTGVALYSRFLRGLARSPDRPAVRLGTDTITYESAHRRALLWAGSLLAGAPEPPAAVGVLAGKGVQSYVGILAGLYAGATVVPLHPAFPTARIRRMLQVAGVTAIVADEQGLAGLPEILHDAPPILVLAPEVDAEVPAPLKEIPVDPAHALAEPRPVTAADTAYMLFTSGSTGVPKGVPISHGSTHHYFGLLDERYDFTPDDVFTQTFDLNFDCAMFDLFCAWGAGASVVCPPPQAYRDMPAFLAEQGVTVWFSTPSSIALLRRMGALVPGSIPTLRWSFFAGEALRLADAADWHAAAVNSTLENLYGPTELTVTITGHRWSPEESPRLGLNGLMPIGRVHPGHDHLLLGADGSPTDADEGELCITGPQMAAGYLDPAQNQGRFVEIDGRTWYRTGDRVRRADNGELVYIGRLDAQVQVQGWRVELAEIEHELRGVDGVEDAVTVTREGDGGTELVVFYTGTPTSPAALARELRRVLPPGMLPKQYRHVDAFPLNPNRKIDRGRLGCVANAIE